MDIKFIRLKNGDDIIARCRAGDRGTEQEDAPYFIVCNPLKVVYFTNPKTGVIGLSFMYWVFPKMAEIQNFKVYTEDILTIADASAYITKSYSRIISKLTEVEEDTLEDSDEDFTAEEAESAELSQEELDAMDFVSDLHSGKKTLH